jgi:hypothetical protein
MQVANSRKSKGMEAAGMQELAQTVRNCQRLIDLYPGQYSTASSRLWLVTIT